MKTGNKQVYIELREARLRAGRDPVTGQLPPPYTPAKRSRKKKRGGA